MAMAAGEGFGLKTYIIPETYALTSPTGQNER